MRLKRADSLLCALACLLVGCGSKTGLVEWDAAVIPPECVTDSDCDDMVWCDGQETCREGHCVAGAPVVCIDGDECTDDACDELHHVCQHTPATQDNDHDGYRGPRPGHRPGDPGSCGDDCDDFNPAVHPGATEVCNGIDDNCNGIIDDGATFTPAGMDTRVTVGAIAPSGPGGVAWTGTSYAASYWGYDMRKAHVYYSPLDRDGNRSGMQTRLTLTPNDAYAGPVVWTGSHTCDPTDAPVLGVVWQDRRFDDYEIFFNRLAPDGSKLGPDVRITDAPGFSINPVIAWTGSEFVLAWQDQRDNPGDFTQYEIYAQRIDCHGDPIGDNVRITHAPGASTGPALGYDGVGHLGIAWTDDRTSPMDDNTHEVWFAAFTSTLGRLGPDARVSDPGQYAIAPTLAWNGDRWVLAWEDHGMASPDHEIWGATRDAGGRPILRPTRLTHDPNFSRSPSLVPLGDRMMLVWADDRGTPDFELWASMLNNNLALLTPEVRVTHAMGDSIAPIATLGPDGDVGVLFQDQREGVWEVYFTRLSCAIGR